MASANRRKRSTNWLIFAFIFVIGSLIVSIFDIQRGMITFSIPLWTAAVMAGANGLIDKWDGK